jgi:hypothetical protein
MEQQPQCLEVPEPRDYSSDSSLENEQNQIVIEEGLTGYSLRVGCQSLYFDNPSNLGMLISYYYANKVKCIRAYRDNKLKELVKQVLYK